MTLGDPIHHHYLVDMLSPEARSYQFHLMTLPIGGAVHLWTETALQLWLSWGIYHTSGYLGEGWMTESIENWKLLVAKIAELEALSLDDLR